MATVHRHADGYFAAVKGAPEAVLPAAERIAEADDTLLDPASRAVWLQRAEALAGEGLRVLAVASRPEADPSVPVEGGLVFLGLIALRDPPRADVAAAVSELRRAGIRVVMATGDHPSTALSISQAVGLTEAGGTVTAGTGLRPLAQLSEDERRALAKERVFARVTPEQKLDLIALFQQQGEVVAMTGDGVNDAPALKKADIGIAMGRRGTQVAREAADMVLLDDAFATIVHAVRQGRIVFGNLRRFSTYLLSCNLAEVLLGGRCRLRRPAAAAPPPPDPLPQPGDGRLPGLRAGARRGRGGCASAPAAAAEGADPRAGAMARHRRPRHRHRCEHARRAGRGGSCCWASRRKPRRPCLS